MFFAKRNTQKNMQLLDKIHTVFTAALTFVCPEGPGAFWYVLFMITYHYFYGTARIIQDHVYIYTTWKSPLPGDAQKVYVRSDFFFKIPLHDN